MAESCLRNKDFDNFIKIEKRKTSIFGENISLWIIIVGKDLWVFGKDIATILDYANPKEALREHVTCEEDKSSIKNLFGDDFKAVLQRSFQGGSKNLPPSFFRNLQPNQILINELGIYSFCTKSRMPKAIPFQRWIYKTITEIRKTGSYNLPGGAVDNPLDLVAKVSNLEKEIKTLRVETIRTCDKETQTPKSDVALDGSFRDLEDKILRALKRNKLSIKRSIEKARLDIKRGSSSSSSSSPHRFYYSSDSE